MALLIFVIFFLNLVASKFYWYSLLWWFDMPMHFLGGVWLGLASVWFYFFGRKHKPMPEINVSRIVKISIISSFVIGLGWELYEYIVQIIVPIANIASPLDSVSDLFFDIAGGAVAAIYLLTQISFGEKSKSDI